MANDPAPDNMKKLWQEQKMETVPMSLDEIRSKARKYQSRIGWRNGREYAALALVGAFFAYSMAKPGPALLRVGEGLCIAAGLYVAWQIRRRGAARPVPADLGFATCLAFHRRELERQRDLLRSVWRWYLGPMVPGLAVIMLAGVMANPGHLRHPKLFIASYAAVVALAFFVVGRWNQRAARRLERQIDEIAALETNP